MVADFAKGGFFETESANGAPTTAKRLLDEHAKSAHIATFSFYVDHAVQKAVCCFEKADNFSLISLNFSKKVHDFFAKGVERKQRQNGDLCQHGVRSPKQSD